MDVYGLGRRRRACARNGQRPPNVFSNDTIDLGPPLLLVSGGGVLSPGTEGSNAFLQRRVHCEPDFLDPEPSPTPPSLRRAAVPRIVSAIKELAAARNRKFEFISLQRRVGGELQRLVSGTPKCACGSLGISASVQSRTTVIRCRRSSRPCEAFSPSSTRWPPRHRRPPDRRPRRNAIRVDGLALGHDGIGDQPPRRQQLAHRR